MRKRFYKHRLLLDEHLPRREVFARLNDYFDLKHIKHDLHHGGMDDPQIYELARDQHRILLTTNVKDFRPLLRPDSAGVVGIPEAWSVQRLDTKLTALLTRHGPELLR